MNSGQTPVPPLRDQSRGLGVLFSIAYSLTASTFVCLAADCGDAGLAAITRELRRRDFTNRVTLDPTSVEILKEIKRRPSELGDYTSQQLSYERDRRSSLVDQPPSSAITQELRLRSTGLAIAEPSELRRELSARDPSLGGLDGDSLRIVIGSNASIAARALAESHARSPEFKPFSAQTLREELSRRSGSLAGYPAESLERELKGRVPFLEKFSSELLEEELHARPSEYADVSRRALLEELAASSAASSLSPREIDEMSSISSQSQLSACSEAELLKRRRDMVSDIKGPDDRQDVGALQLELAASRRAGLGGNLTSVGLEEAAANRALESAKSVGILVSRTSLICKSGKCRLSTDPYGQRDGLCPGTRFMDQPAVRSACSGFLLRKAGQFATARHCVMKALGDSRGPEPVAASVDDLRVVFNYEVWQSVARLEFAETDVYSIAALVSYGSGDADWAVLRLSREPQEPGLALRSAGGVPRVSTPLYVIGYPEGLPKKLSGNAGVQEDYHSGYFTADLDAFAGNSGSPVVNVRTNEVEGILRGGAKDYRYLSESHCNEVGVCLRLEACLMEVVTDITDLRNSVGW
jgi:hypothetical protein